MFGQDFEKFETPEELDEEPITESSNPSAPRVDKGKKGKLAAKSTGFTYQFQIMESIGVPRSEIKKFADPYYWLTYFPPIAIVSFIHLSPSSHRPFAYSGRPPRLGDAHRLASFFHDNTSKPLLRRICTLADEQAPRIRQDQIRRTLHYLQPERRPALYGPRSRRWRGHRPTRIYGRQDASHRVEFCGTESLGG